MSLLEKITKIAEYVTNGFHAIPKQSTDALKNLPSMHRFSNVLGMVIGFSGMKYVADIIFGQKINGSQCEEIKKEKVFILLRPLHGMLQYNYFSDAPRDRWRKVLHQMIPAAGGAIGAIKGSEMFFAGRGGKEYQMLLEQVKKGHTLTPLQAEQVVSFAQGKTWRLWAGLSAWVSSATGLTGLLYGGTLNTAFLLCNQAKTAAGAAELTGLNSLRAVSNTQSEMGLGPNKALAAISDSMERVFHKPVGQQSAYFDAFSQKITKAVILPFKNKMSAEEQRQISEKIRKVIDEEYQAHRADKKFSEVRKSLQNAVNTIVASLKDKQIGNNGILGKAAEFADFRGTIEASRAAGQSWQAR